MEDMLREGCHIFSLSLPLVSNVISGKLCVILGVGVPSSLAKGKLKIFTHSGASMWCW